MLNPCFKIEEIFLVRTAHVTIQGLLTTHPSVDFFSGFPTRKDKSHLPVVIILQGSKQEYLHII